MVQLSSKERLLLTGICGVVVGKMALTFIVEKSTMLYRRHIVHPKLRICALEQLSANLQNVQRFVSSDGFNCPAPHQDDCRMIGAASSSQLLFLMGDSVDSDPIQLPSGMQRPVSAVYVLKCFYSNALAAHRNTNCLVAVMLEDAIAGALRADAVRSRGAHTYRLLGIPISIKENYQYAGTDATLGLHDRLGKPHPPSEQDAAIVRHLRSREGAVFFCKTNVPQTLLTYECENYVFGTTTNPFNPLFTCGGSSGGEGALIKLGGSIMGIGNDIGGSLRHPAVFCGVYGFRPTTGRFPFHGSQRVFPGAPDGVPAVSGPMANTMENLITLFQCSLGADNDATLTHYSFDGSAFESCGAKTKIRFGFTVNDSAGLGVSPANKRAVLEAVEALRAAGHECVEIPFLPWGDDALKCFYNLLGADGGANFLNLLKTGERPLPFLNGLLASISCPAVLKPILGQIVKLKFGNSHFFGDVIASTRKLSIHDYYILLARRNDIRSLVATRLFSKVEHEEAPSGHKSEVLGRDDKLQCDAIIVPSFAMPPPKCGESKDLSFAVMYTSYFNLLDMPSCTFATTTVDASKDGWSEKTTGLRSVLQRFYDAEEMHGLPVGVQIATKRGTDEECLAISNIVDKIINGHR